MKKKFGYILLAISSAILAACSPQQDPAPPKVVAKYLKNLDDVTYSVGDEFSISSREGYVYCTEYSDGTITTKKVDRVNNPTSIANPSLSYESDELIFKTSGVNHVRATYYIGRDSYNSYIRCEVKSPEENGYTLSSMELVNPLAYIADFTFNESNPMIGVNLTWRKNTSVIEEYSNNVSGKFNGSLVYGEKQLDLSKDKLLEGNTYQYTHKYKEETASKLEFEFTITKDEGYYKMEESSLVYEEFENAAPHLGKTNLLVVLLEIEPGSAEYTEISWTKEWETTAKNYFFGTRDKTPKNWNSLKTYYETTSHGKIQIDGVISSVYEANPNKYTMKSILESSNPYYQLHYLMNDAIRHLHDTLKINWSDYDRNDDGRIDNLHFITNVDKTTSNKGSENGRALWPHKYQILPREAADLNYPTGDVYECTALGHFSDPNTIIHEQGHVFGIDDYYDYAYSGADYVGCLDMQSHNVFDWNSFSKFSVGWSRPYVVDGTEDVTTLAINPASLAEDFVVIPANHSTYNGSAFDEYFLVEFFTNDGNNTLHWKEYLGATITQGIKIYHVDARLSNYRGATPTIEQIKSSYKNAYTHGTDNNIDGSRASNPNWKDYKLLAIIQQGGVDTFGEADGANKYDYLTTDDLFHPGEKFTFDKYKHFLSKSGKTVTTTDEGEVFPYEITVQNFVGKQAIITIEKK